MRWSWNWRASRISAGTIFGTTFATCHRQAGTPTHELQRLGGWKTGAMVERYAHVAPEALQGAAARLDAITGYVAATPEASPERPTA